MIVVFTGFVFCVFLSLISHNSTIVNRNVFLPLSFLILWCIHTNIDYLTFPDLTITEYVFKSVSNYNLTNIKDMFLLGQINGMEIGILLLMKLCSYITLDFHFFLGIYNLLLLGFYFYIIIKFSSSINLSILLIFLTFFLQSFFVVRQHLAVALAFFTYQFLIARDLKKFLLFMLVAFFIHKSSIIWLPMYFLYGVKNNKMLVLYLLVSTIGISYIFGNLAQLSKSVTIGYDSYITGDKEGVANYTEFFISLSFISTYVIKKKKKVLNNGINRLIFISITINTILSLYGVNLGILTRLKLYYYVCIIFIIPETYKHFQNPFIKVLYLIGVFFCLSLLTFLGPEKPIFDIVSYSFFSSFTLISMTLIVSVIALVYTRYLSNKRDRISYEKGSFNYRKYRFWRC